MLDSTVLEELKIAYFSIEEVNIQNVNVVSESGSISSLKPSRRTDVPVIPFKPRQVPKNILELINKSFGATTSDFEQVYVLSEAAKSLALYKQADFTTSFVLSWFLLERFIEARWERYLEAENKELDHGQNRINANQKQTLTDSRSYPVSVKLQFLELAGELSFSQFLDLDFLRGKRNEIVHPPKGHKKDLAVRGEPESCNKAFELLKQFIASDFNLQVNFSTSYVSMGIYDR